MKKSNHTETRSEYHQRLINATIRVISDSGLSQTTSEKVAKTAGQSTSIVNFHFKSKKQLLLATLSFLSEEYNGKVAEIFSSKGEPPALITAFIKMSFSKEICDIHKVAVWYAFTSESRARQDYKHICGEKDASCNAQLARLFTSLCADSGRAGKDAMMLAVGLDGLIQNYWQALLYEPEDFNRQKAIADCIAYMYNLFPQKFPPAAPAAPAAATNGEVLKSDLLPKWTYQNEEFFRLEINEIFRRNWLLTGHISDIPRKGDYYTMDCFGERVLIIRDTQNQVRAYHNVCRHRGARLISAPKGNCPKRLTCPFHGWSYGLDGKLKTVPLARTFPNLDKSDISLTSIECDIWQGFIFIRFTGGGVPLGEQMQPLDDIVAPYLPQELKSFAARYTEQRPYNWKIIHDIDNEGYHVPVGHPGLQSLYGKNYKDLDVGGFSVSIGSFNKPHKSDTWSSALYKKILPDFPHLPKKNSDCWLYVGVFPNLVLAFYPDMMEFYQTLPIDPMRTTYYAGSYALADDRRAVRLCRYLNRRINDETDTEDEDFVSWMQEGLNSSAFPQFTLSTIEEGVRDFHKKIQAVLPVAEINEQPSFGTVAQTNQRLSG